MNSPTDNYKNDTDSKTQALNECYGNSLCAKCFCFQDNGGFCIGCNEEYQKQCLKRVCALNCSTCSGGKRTFTIGCCGHAPASWLEEWKRTLEYKIPDYSPVSLKIKNRVIPVLHSIRKFNIPEEFPEIDTWVVPIHKVANLSGKFISTDLKDYLGIPADRKLILSTCAPDNYQEMLWEKGPDINYDKHNIDYWFPAHFSIYDNDSKLYQFASAKRQLIHAIWTESHFAWFRLGENIRVDFLAPIRKASSILISLGQMYSQHNRDILRKEVEIADQWFPQRTAFFVLGKIRSLPISSSRSCYEINSNWLMRGIKGRDLNGKRVEKLSIKEVLINNLKSS